jgi:hypothetical protein
MLGAETSVSAFFCATGSTEGFKGSALNWHMLTARVVNSRIRYFYYSVSTSFFILWCCACNLVCLATRLNQLTFEKQAVKMQCDFAPPRVSMELATQPALVRVDR